MISQGKTSWKDSGWSFTAFEGSSRWNTTTEAVKTPRNLSRGSFSVTSLTVQCIWRMLKFFVYWLTWIKFRVVVGYRLLRFVDCILGFEFEHKYSESEMNKKSGELTNGWQSKTLRCDDVRKDLRKEGRARQSVTLFKGNVGTILAEFWNFGLWD